MPLQTVELTPLAQPCAAARAMRRASGAAARRRVRAATALLAALLGTAPWTAHAQGQAACAAWPGELAPLPTVRSEDAISARWAELRAQELDRLARALATTNPASAHRLWRHALCLNPTSEALRGQLAALAPRSQSIAAPLVVRRRPPAPAQLGDALAAADLGIQAVSSALAEARFRDVLERAAAARALLEQESATPDVLERRARLEVMTSTAQLALGRDSEATQSLRRALAADPELELDAATPPKVRRLLAGIRAETSVGAQ
jgi:hypothetical protein